MFEDDYLGEKQKASIEQELAPAKVTWEPGYRIDGRHGRCSSARGWELFNVRQEQRYPVAHRR